MLKAVERYVIRGGREGYNRLLVLGRAGRLRRGVFAVCSSAS